MRYSLASLSSISSVSSAGSATIVLIFSRLPRSKTILASDSVLPGSMMPMLTMSMWTLLSLATQSVGSGDICGIDLPRRKLDVVEVHRMKQVDHVEDRSILKCRADARQLPAELGEAGVIDVNGRARRRGVIGTRGGRNDRRQQRETEKYADHVDDSPIILFLSGFHLI